jgi:hypothetical protein
MLISNFLKTKLQAQWGASRAYSGFTLYAGIGFASSSQEISACFKAVRSRVAPDCLKSMFDEGIQGKYSLDERLLHNAAKGMYSKFKKKIRRQLSV